jgi:hypothetical protein
MYTEHKQLLLKGLVGVHAGTIDMLLMGSTEGRSRVVLRRSCYHFHFHLPFPLLPLTSAVISLHGGAQ